VSLTNRELTERAYGALERRDLQGFLDLIDPDVEFHSLIAEAEGQTFRGHDGVREWWERVAGALGGVDFEFEHFRDLGDSAVVRVGASGEAGGVSVSQTMYQAIRAREGKAVWWGTFRTEEEALTAVEEAK
jgi:ketosteroid isomerase-like protein